MGIENNRAVVLSFFDKFINNYIIKDLEVLKSIKPNEFGLGACTIPTAMTIISTTELLGFLLKEDGKTGESKNNISYFFNYPKKSLFPPSYGTDVIDKLFNYRHGMMHHFFPKYRADFAGICKDENNSNLFISQSINGRYQDSLNVTVLANDFLEAIGKLNEFLKTTDEERILDTILNGLKNLDYYLEIATTTTCTTIPPGTPKNK